jgi:hypothetical protein
MSEPKGTGSIKAGNMKQRIPVTSGLSDTVYNSYSNNGNDGSFNDYSFNPSLGKTPRRVHNNHANNGNTGSFNYNSDNIASGKWEFSWTQLLLLLFILWLLDYPWK